MTRSAGLVFMVPTRFVEWLHQVTTGHPERHVLVLIPELVHRRWYQFLVNHRATRH